MALARVREYVKNDLGKSITPTVKSELAKLGLEQYSFKKYYILSYYENRLCQFTNSISKI